MMIEYGWVGWLLFIMLSYNNSAKLHINCHNGLRFARFFYSPEELYSLFIRTDIIIPPLCLAISGKRRNLAANMTQESQYNPVGEWWTAPAESDSGRLIMVTGRRDVAKFRSNPKFSVRVEVTWPYEADATGMPTIDTSSLMQQATELLQKCFDKDPVAVMTGIYTGDGERNWVFYTLSLNIFGRKLNEALAPLPLLPLKISAAEDPDWAEYDEMSEAEIKLD